MGLPKATGQQGRSCSIPKRTHLSVRTGRLCTPTSHRQAHKDDAWLAPPKHLLGSSHSLAQRVLDGVSPLVDDQGDAQVGPRDIADAKVIAVPQQQPHEGLQGDGQQQSGQGAPFSSLQSQASSRALLLQCGSTLQTEA